MGFTVGFSIDAPFMKPRHSVTVDTKWINLGQGPVIFNLGVTMGQVAMSFRSSG